MIIAQKLLYVKGYLPLSIVVLSAGLLIGVAEKYNDDESWESTAQVAQQDAAYWEQKYIEAVLLTQVPLEPTDDELNELFLKYLFENADAANLSITLDSSGYFHGFLAIYFDNEDDE